MATASVSFAQLLQHHRAAAGLTQEELAERARLSARAISDLERGVKQRPYAYTVQRLVQALGLDAPEAARFERAARRRGERVCGAAPLPVPPTPFIGRQREVRVVSALLRRADVRLLTLTGPGGVGKTRLAVQAAAAVAATFPDGVAFVALASLADPVLVPTALATTLGLPEARGQPVLATLTRHLQPLRLLLVLDNFEHLRPAADVVAHLLGACPHLTVLVTSRALLQLAAEYTYAVPPLVMPPRDHQTGLDTLVRYDAVRLFLQRAAAVQPGFALTSENAGAIAGICQQVDGLPLALELVAARLRLFPPPALVARLEHRLPLLAGGPRDQPLRHQTMRQTIDWSYRLLTADEQRLFARLAVFAGGCAFTAIEAVCQADATLDVLAGTTALVAQCLLRSDGDAEPRFAMLETIREYALERLEACGEAENLRRQHTAYYLRLAEQAELELTGPEQGEWLARLEAEHANLRAALIWCSATGEGQTGLRLAGALWRFWLVRGHLREGRGWLEEMLARSGPAASAVRAKGLRGAGVLAGEQGDYEQARALQEEALALARDRREAAGIASALSNLGVVAWKQGDYKRATALYEEALALFRGLGETWGTAMVLNHLGYVARRQGDDGWAAILIEAALALLRDHGDRRGIAHTLANLGSVAAGQEDYGRARALQEEALALFRDLGETRGIAVALGDLGYVAEMQGDYERARALYEEALVLVRDQGDRRGIANTLASLGFVAAGQEDDRRARALGREALALARELRDQMLVAECLELLARVACEQAQPERATRLCAAAAVVRAAIGAPLPPAERANYGGTVTAARAVLGPSAFALAWAAGEALSLEQAIAEALAGRAAAHDAPLRHLRTQPQAVPQAMAPARPRLSRADRQAWVVERLHTGGALSPGAYAAALGVSTDTALRDLQELVVRGRIQATGTTRDRRYELAGEAVGPAIHRTAP